MRWVAISGSWRKTNEKLVDDVKSTVQEIIGRGDGIVSGGALGVDYIATDEALRLFPRGDRIKVFLPTALRIYVQHYRNRAKEGVITSEQAESLIEQLQGIAAINPEAIVESPGDAIAERETYFKRNSAIVGVADELIAFHVNESEGTRDAIEKARKKGIPVEVHSYQIT